MTTNVRHNRVLRLVPVLVKTKVMEMNVINLVLRVRLATRRATTTKGTTTTIALIARAVDATLANVPRIAHALHHAAAALANQPATARTLAVANSEFFVLKSVGARKKTHNQDF